MWNRLEAGKRAEALEDRAARERSLSPDILRERRDAGLARARAITAARAVEDGALHIPLLLLSTQGSREEEMILSGEVRRCVDAHVPACA